jgi:hypothetical protein
MADQIDRQRESPIDAAFRAIMITASCAGDYQHAAEELVGIERKGLSVFGLQK